jgi:type VI secretion system protein ImpE
MTAEESLRAGQLDEALAGVRSAVKKAPTDAKPRIFLFQLLSVLGQWDKALTQLQVLREMDADSMLLAEIFTPVLHCEALRAEVFAGRRSPLIFGEPEEWIGLLLQANQLVAEGKFDAAAELRARAFEAAPAVSGKINEHAFDWIADADSRLGPLLEVIMEGKYYWVPFHRIQRVKMEAPTDLRNFVWTAAQFTWTNGGNTPGFVPTRYPGSESVADSSIRLAKKTDWLQKDAETYIGLGQRLFATNETELPLLEVRSLELAAAPLPQ